MSTSLTISKAQARRFACLATGLSRPFDQVEEALEHLGYVQLDPLNVCGRMHDLILRNRVKNYQEGALLQTLHSPRRPGFEYFLPGAGILVAFPANAWTQVLPSMLRLRKTPGGHRGSLDRTEGKLAEEILAEIRCRGPLCSDDLEHEGRCETPWGSQGRLVKRVLDKLFNHGRVLITERRGFRRVYDLTERVLPEALLKKTPATPEENARWLVLTKLRQRRLAALKRSELPWVVDLVQPLSIEGARPLYCLKEDLPLLEESAEPEPAKLLAPLDPLIYDRRTTEQLWDFSYTWEVYTPEHKRVRGYFALPVLSKGEMAGHLEPRADRKAGHLSVVSKKVKRGHTLSPAFKELAFFLGLRAKPGKGSAARGKKS